MKFLGLLCIFVALGIRVEGRFLSTQIGNSLPALNYRITPSNEVHPAFMTRSRRTNLRKIQSAKIDIDDEIQETSLKRSTRRTIASDFRGGSAAAAKVARTMTARRMESLNEAWQRNCLAAVQQKGQALRAADRFECYEAIWTCTGICWGCVERLLSGGAAGTVAACITNPLEVVKTQLQSSNSAKSHPVEIFKKIFDTDGIPGFWRGLPPTLVGIIPSRSAYFYAYQKMKTFLDPALPEGSPPNALIAGFTAGIVGNTLTNPIWMVRTRMQILVDTAAGQKQYAGYGDAIKTIFREEGIGGFYKGISASYWGCAEGATQFLIYEQIKSKLIERQNKHRRDQGLRPTQELSKATYFWAAAASKAVAAVATYPHEVARTRMREHAREGVFKYQKGMWETLGTLAQEEGFKSLYSGMGVHLMKVVPNSALMFLTYEVVRSYLDRYDVVG